MLTIESRPFSYSQGLFACIQCGKCTGGCPISMKTNLNPRGLIYRLLVAGNGFDLEACQELWDCTTCATCFSRCPKEVNPMEVIIALRSSVVESGRVPPNVKTALESTFRHGNPLTFLRENRDSWADGLSIPIFSAQCEYLYFVGCTPAYDPEVQRSARALTKLLMASGVNFGILGTNETCCGSEIRRLGEFGLFEMLVEDNLALFSELDVHKLLTTSPHCFNTFKNDYPLDGLQPEHYTQVLANLLQHGQLHFHASFEHTITYHDPCYLSKHNSILDEPRFILQSIPGAKFVEMDRIRQKSLCCEGGGGRMWLEGTNPHTRLARWRIQEALDTGADILATACPFCFLTLSEAVKHANAEDRIRVMDVAEIAAQVL